MMPLGNMVKLVLKFNDEQKGPVQDSPFQEKFEAFTRSVSDNAHVEPGIRIDRRCVFLKA
jgi:hypothetical protein